MKQIVTTRIFIIGVLAIAMVFGSCRSNQDLNSGGIVQKRKYTKGYHINAKINKSQKAKGLKAASILAADSTQSNSQGIQAHTNQALSAVKDARSQDEVAVKTAELVHANASGKAKTEQTQETARMVVDVKKPTSVKASKNAVMPSQDLSQAVPRTTPTSAILSFLFGIVGLFVAAIVMGPLAIIFGIVGLSRIDSNPSAYKGKGFAIVGLILGIISLIVILALLSTV